MDLNLFSKILSVWENIKSYFLELKGLTMRMKVTFGILFFLSVLGILLGGFLGCASPGELYIEANYKFATDTLPDFIGYIEKDESLSNLDKEIRKDSILEWKKLIEMTYFMMKKE